MTNLTAPIIKEPGFFPFPDYELIHLSNGIPVYLIPFNNIDYTNILLSIKAVTQLQTKVFQAATTSRMLREGCKDFNSEQLAEELDFYGTVLKCATSVLNSETLMSCVSRQMPKMMPLLQNIVFNPTFPKKEFAIVSELSKQNLIHSMQEVSYLANVQFKKMLFGDEHVYAKTATPEGYDSLSVDDLVQFHNEYYSPDNTELFVAGRLTDKELTCLDNSIGSMPFNGKVVPTMVEPTPNTCSDIRRLNKKNGCQNAVVMGYVTIPQQHPDFLKLKFLVSVLGGYFGSRLMSNIREDKGYTYGIYAQLVAYSGLSTLVISSQTAVEHTDDLIKEVYNEINKLVNEPIPDEELQMVKRYYTGLYLQQVSKGIDLLSDHRLKVLNGLDTKSYYEQWWNVLHTITAEELLHIAKKYLKPELVRISVAGS